MMNLCSLSKATLAVAFSGLLGILTLLFLAVVDPGPRFLFIGSNVLSLASLAAAIWLLRGAVLTLDEAALVCHRAFVGDLEARIQRRREPGRLGRIQKSVNDMLDIVDAFVREASASMEAASRSRSHRKILVRGLPGSFRRSAAIINSGTDNLGHRVIEIADLAKSFGARLDQIASELTRATGDLESDAERMSASAEETSQQSASVMQASDQASSNVQTVAAAAEQLSSSINEIARQVNRSKEATGRAVSEVGRADLQIRNLASAVIRIDDVVKLISAIAEQTNLLALNATIEAARAGEVGRGFAVVASEVKALASQTAKATDEIGSKVSEMQESSAISVGAVETISRTISEINEVTTAIAAAIEQQSAATGAISHNVQQASAGTSEVAANVSGIRQAATDTGHVATRVNSASERLQSEVEVLRREVTAFLQRLVAA